MVTLGTPVAHASPEVPGGSVAGPHPRPPPRGGGKANLASLERVKLPLVEVPLVVVLGVATTLNLALILGGTLYAGYKVTSIQKTYEEAESRLKLADDKYQAAVQSYDDASGKARRAGAQIDDVLAKAASLDSQLAMVQGKRAETIARMTDEADKQSGRIQTEVAKFTAALAERQARTQSELDATGGRTVAAVQAYGATVERQTKTALDSLASQKADVEKLQLDTRVRLFEATKTNARFSDDLDAIRKSSKLDLEMAWVHSDTWIRALVVALLAFNLLLLCKALYQGVRRVFRAK